MPTIEALNHTIYYQTVGEGRPLLLMHGWTDVGRDLLSVAESLPEYQCILPDLPGYGNSVPPHRTFPQDFYFRDAGVMCAFLDEISLKDVHIAGFSDGGEVALLMPIMRPDLCRSVMAWGAVGAFGLDAAQRARQGKMPSWFDTSLEAKHPGQDVYSWHRAWVEGFAAMIEAGGDLSLGRASEILCPLFLMLGEHDTLNPIVAGERFIRQAAREKMIRRLEAFKGAGHAIHSEQPEAFIAAYRAFLKDVDKS